MAPKKSRWFSLRGLHNRFRCRFPVHMVTVDTSALDEINVTRWKIIGWNLKLTHVQRKIMEPKPSLLCSVLIFRGVSAVLNLRLQDLLNFWCWRFPINKKNLEKSSWKLEVDRFGCRFPDGFIKCRFKTLRHFIWIGRGFCYFTTRARKFAQDCPSTTWYSPKPHERYTKFCLVYIALCFYVVPHFEIWDKLQTQWLPSFTVSNVDGKMILVEEYMIQLASDYHLT